VHRSFAIIVFVLAAVLAAGAQARAGLLVAPTRLVFHGSERHGEFVLVNRGSTSERYRVSVVNRRMSPEGRIVEAPEPLPDERFADGMIRFAPRMVVLPPDEPQTIRILVRKPGDLPRGEYRSHLLLQQVPDAPPPAAVAEPEDPRGISLRVTPIYGITVPVIVRHGQLRARAALSDFALRVDEGVPRLHLRIDREGERSFHGDLVVRYEPPGEEPRVVGRANGVSVYTPNRSRPFALELDFPGGQIPSHGRLAVEYRDAEEGASSLIAEASVVLAGP
jgi:hypothetical protein